MREEFLALGAALDRALPGHPSAVEALLLGLVAREHVWLEGPVGCGKTRLARALLRACEGPSAWLDFDRDTRVSAGAREQTLRRTRVGNGERIEVEDAPHPLETAQIAVLDDPARAPREVLAPLFGALARRRLPASRRPLPAARGVAARALPLETAVATGLPAAVSGDRALSGAMLDVFALQVRMRGLLTSGDFETARRVLLSPPADVPVAVLDPAARSRAQREAASLLVAPGANAALLSAIERLRPLARAEVAGGLSDRSFGPAALRVMRAHAWLRGAARVEPEDVRALELMLARRIPQVHVESAIAALQDAETQAPGAEVAGAGSHAGTAGESAASGAAEPPRPPVDALLPDAPARRTPRDADAEIDALVRALAGALGGGRASPREDPAGTPRAWRRLRGLDEVADADPGEVWLWASGRSPELPRVPRRERRNRGGAVAVLRDVSASMEGRLGAWAGDVVAALAALGRRRGLELGYVEFNHDAHRFAEGRRFFHRRYDAVAALGARRRCEGRTNYQAALGLALEELARTPERERHVVLLTDGVPVVGDPQVRGERARARRLGVRVHTVFLGTGPHPDVLDALARETGGLAFRARPRHAAGGRRLVVEPREAPCTNA
ncbi:MAG: AAA family ATPase [Deltaproteobacteria bacterium]|nr:AAA family ATPase [Deltaproteobacteria bacterium]